MGSNNCKTHATCDLVFDEILTNQVIYKKVAGITIRYNNLVNSIYLRNHDLKRIFDLRFFVCIKLTRGLEKKL